MTILIITCAIIIIYLIIIRVKKQTRFNQTLCWLHEEVEFNCIKAISKLSIEQRYSIYNILNIFGEFTIDDHVNSNKVRQLLFTWLNALKITPQESLNYFKSVNESGTILKLKEIEDEFLMDMVFFSAYAFTQMAYGYINGISCEAMSKKFFIDDFKKLGFDNNKFAKAQYLFSH